MGSSESERKYYYGNQSRNHRIIEETSRRNLQRPRTLVHALHFENDLDGLSSLIFCIHTKLYRAAATTVMMEMEG